MKKFIKMYNEELMFIIIVIILSLLLNNKYLLITSLLLILLLIYFNRSHNKYIIKNNDYILSPANGKIISITYDDFNIIIDIFLNLHNIHKQYMPINGTIIKQEYINGSYKHADDISANNAKIITYIASDIGQIIIEQVSGLLIRKIVSYVKPKEYIKQGTEIGMIKFGSRVRLIVPRNRVDIIRNINAKVNIGDFLLKIRK